MVMPYSTIASNSTQLLDLMLFVNNATELWFGRLIIITIFLIAFISMSKGTEYGTGAFVGAAFVTTVLAWLLVGAGLFKETEFIYCVILLIIGIAALYWNKD